MSKRTTPTTPYSCSLIYHLVSLHSTGFEKMSRAGATDIFNLPSEGRPESEGSPVGLSDLLRGVYN